MLYIIFCISAAIVIDVLTFKRFDAAAYNKIFSEFYSLLKIVLIFVLITIFFSSEKKMVVQVFFVFFLSPLYLIKRRQFIKELGGRWLESGQSLMISDACEVVICWLLSMYACLGLIRIGEEFFGSYLTEIEMLMIVSIISSIVVLWLIYRASKRFAGKNFLSKLGVRKPRMSLFKTSLAAICYGITLAFISAFFMATREIQPETPFGDMMENMATTSGFFLFLVAAMLTAPFIEEIIFRGYFFAVLRKTKGKVFASVAIILAFAFMHVDQYWGDWLAILMVTLIGLVLTFLRVFTGSVIPSIIMHYVYNSGVLIFSTLFIVLQNPTFFEYVVNSEQYSVEKQVQMLKKSIERKPSFTDAYNLLALLYFDEGRMQDALNNIEAALEVHPQRPAYLDTKAIILLALDRAGEAAVIEKQLRDSNPRYSIGDYQSDLTKMSDLDPE